MLRNAISITVLYGKIKLSETIGVFDTKIVNRWSQEKSSGCGSSNSHAPWRSRWQYTRLQCDRQWNIGISYTWVKWKSKYHH